MQSDPEQKWIEFELGLPIPFSVDMHYPHTSTCSNDDGWVRDNSWENMKESENISKKTNNDERNKEFLLVATWLDSIHLKGIGSGLLLVIWNIPIWSEPHVTSDYFGSVCKYRYHLNSFTFYLPIKNTKVNQIISHHLLENSQNEPNVFIFNFWIIFQIETFFDGNIFQAWEKKKEP